MTLTNDKLHCKGESYRSSGNFASFTNSTISVLEKSQNQRKDYYGKKLLSFKVRKVQMNLGRFIDFLLILML